jgi:serine/threonine-protein kinase
LKLRRYVAIKEFLPDGCLRQGNTVRPDGTWSDDTYTNAKAKFLDEARVLAQFRHNGVVQVYTFFEEQHCYMVMEYLKGKTLAQLVEKRGALPGQEAVGYIEKAAEALEEVHRVKLLHRDIKPENIMLCEDGRVLLIDFGLTKKVEEAVDLGTRQLSTTTRFGSDGYAPPEQYLKNGVLGTYTDVYSLGATLYFLLT